MHETRPVGETFHQTSREKIKRIRKLEDVFLYALVVAYIPLTKTHAAEGDWEVRTIPFLQAPDRSILRGLVYHGVASV